MNEKKADESRYRRWVFRLFDQEKSVAEILQRVPRSRTWLFKGKKRVEQQRWHALASLSKAPNCVFHTKSATDFTRILPPP